MCTDASISADEKNLYLSSKVQMKMIVLSEESKKILVSSDLVEGGEYESVGAKITVYYPEEGEKLFDIAKKFHTTTEKIISANSVSCSASPEGSSRIGRLILL